MVDIRIYGSLNTLQFYRHASSTMPCHIVVEMLLVLAALGIYFEQIDFLAPVIRGPRARLDVVLRFIRPAAHSQFLARFEDKTVEYRGHRVQFCRSRRSIESDFIRQAVFRSRLFMSFWCDLARERRVLGEQQSLRVIDSASTHPGTQHTTHWHNFSTRPAGNRPVPTDPIGIDMRSPRSPAGTHQLTCAKCGQLVIPDEQQQHQAVNCVVQPCSYCAISVPRNQIPEHHLQCSQFPVICETCGVSKPRTEINAHAPDCAWEHSFCHKALFSSCVICLEPFGNTPTKNVRFTSCGHFSHDTCLNQWFAVQRSENRLLTCPQCRKALDQSAPSAQPYI